MAQSLEGRLATQAYPVDDLVELVRQGEVRIPSFQRGLRWTRFDVIKLFDSIVLGYPIGNLLLWRRPAEADPELRVGALEINAPKMEQALFVVDGQQRLTSLANALSEEGHRDPRFALAYDAVAEKFVPLTPGRQVATEIPLPVIFDLTRLLRWFSERPELTAEPGMVDQVNRVAKAIREYRVPVYIVDQSDPAVLRDIFDRMNNYGKKLTRAEVFSALHETGTDEVGTHTGMTDLAEIAQELHAATGYGLVDENTILLASLARRSHYISRDIRNEFSTSVVEFPSETPKEAQLNTQNALIAAVNFLQADAHAPHFSFLPYRYLLVVLTRFFGHFESPSMATRRNLRRWLWRAASLGPDLTRGNITHATRTLCSKIVPGDEVGSVEGLLSLVNDEPSSIPDVVEFRTNWADTRLVLAAMWERRPYSLAEMRPYDLNDILFAVGESNTANAQAVQLFRSAAVPAELRSKAGNRAIFAEADGLAPENPIETFRAMVQGLLDDDADAALASHLIEGPVRDALVQGRDADFINLRHVTIGEVLRNFLARQCEWSFENTPSLISLEVEDEPRDDELPSVGEDL